MSETFKKVRYGLVGLLLLFCAAVQAQTISGNVKDAAGEPIIGATVMEQGTQNGTVTDFDGNFTLKLQKGGNLNISYVGMKPQVIKTAGKSSVNVTLEDDNTTLNDLVVVGYGTMKRSDLTGSVSSVNTEQLNAKGASSVLGNLQGATPGVNITMAGGRTDGAPTIEIRGKSSINSGTTPLYVVDGVMCDDIDWLNPQDIEKIDILKDASSTAIYGSRATAGVVMVTTKSGTTVSKDAKATISYDGYFGWKSTTRMPEFQNAKQFYDYRFLKFLGYQNGAAAQPAYTMTPSNLEQGLLRQHSGSGSYVLKDLLAQGVDTDWPSLMTQKGMQQNHYLAVNGSSKGVSYHFGVGYNKEEGVYVGDEQSRYNFKGAVDAQITNWLDGGFNINFAESNKKYANDNAIKEAFRMNPFIQPYDANGNIVHQPGLNTALGTDANQFTSSRNPLHLKDSSKKKRETWRLLGNIYLNFKPMKGLSFKTTFSPNYQYYREGYFDGYMYTDLDGTEKYYDDDKRAGNTAYNANQRAFSWTWDNVLSYNTRINDIHSINAMALYSTQKSTTEYVKWFADNVRYGTDWWNLATGEYNATESSNKYSEYSMTSWAMRLNYGFKDRYLFTGTVRWDGSSKFAKDNRWGTFPSLAFAWRITEEPWMKKYEKISNLKLRISYGITGNCDGIGNYDTRSLLADPVYYPYNGTTQSTGYYSASIVDKDLKWEKSQEFNIGLDFGFWNNRLNGSIDWYTKKSKDLLYDVSLPLEAGIDKSGKPLTMTTNIGSVRNTGVEIALNGVLIRNKDFEWTAGMSFAHNKNEVKEINGVDNKWLKDTNYGGITGVVGSLFVGESVNNVWAYTYDGIVSDKMMTLSQKQKELYGEGATDQMRECDYYYKVYNWTEGQPILTDRNQDGNIDDDDRTVMSSDPDWTGSFNTNINWKNWDFGFSLYARVGGKVYSAFMNQYIDYSDRGRQRLNLDYYIPAGALIDCDGINDDGSFINPVYQQSTHYGEYPFPNNGSTDGAVGNRTAAYNNAASIVSASFMKVKNITLGYTFPKKWLTPWGCSHLRLYFTVTNPICFSKFKGFDPEWASATLANDGPSTVTYQVGASIKF